VHSEIDSVLSPAQSTEFATDTMHSAKHWVVFVSNLVHLGASSIDWKLGSVHFGSEDIVSDLDSMHSGGSLMHDEGDSALALQSHSE